IARNRVLTVLTGKGGLLAERPDAGAGAIVSLHPIVDGLFLAVDMAVAGLEEMTLEAAERRLRAFAPGATVESAQGAMAIGPDDTVVRAVVLVGITNYAYFGGDDSRPVHLMPLEDLRWIV